MVKPGPQPMPTNMNSGPCGHTAICSPSWLHNGLHSHNPCKLHRLLLIYRPQKDGRLGWPSWLTHSGQFTHKVNLLLLLLLLLQMKRLKWCCRKNAAGALYKIIKREKLVNASQSCGRIEMSSAGVWMEWGRKQFEEMVVDCSMHAVQW